MTAPVLVAIFVFSHKVSNFKLTSPVKSCKGGSPTLLHAPPDGVHDILKTKFTCFPHNEQKMLVLMLRLAAGLEIKTQNQNHSGGFYRL